MKTKTGKTVYLIDKEGNIRTDKTYKVKTIKGENKDYLTLYKIESEDGKIYAAEDWRCVVIPDKKIEDECDRVTKYLSDNSVFYDDIFTDGRTISINIYWGDWKHDHWRLDNFMEAIGYKLQDEVVTEEDGSDNYSSVHTFEKAA